MRTFAVSLSALIWITLTALGIQDSNEASRQNDAEVSLAISLHYHDGLSASSCDEIPEIRFLRSDCHLSLLVTNKTRNDLILWKPNCPNGDYAIRMEFKKRLDSKIVGIARPSYAYTGGMGIPKTFTLASDDSLVYRIALRSWSLPFVLDDHDDTTVFVRAAYLSPKLEDDRFLPKNADDVWVGEITTEWQEVRLSNASGARIETRNKVNILE